MGGGVTIVNNTMKNKKEETPDCQFVHVGRLVDHEIYRQDIGKKEFAFQVNIDRSNLYRILKKKSMDTNQLLLFSKALNHNFFRDLADAFDQM